MTRVLTERGQGRRRATSASVASSVTFPAVSARDAAGAAFDA